MPRFAPIAEFLGETLDLPVLVRGKEKTYSVAPCSAEVGLRLTARFSDAKKKAADSDDADEEVVDDETETGLYRAALGDVYDELVADGVPYSTLKVVGQTAVIWHVYGEKAAAFYWEAGGDPKRSATSDSTSTSENPETPAAARSTRKPASASGTTRSRTRARTGGTSSSAGSS
ncbi:hypothetical protein Skr01_36260 [Sphaerisporangium krabiense]|uniref:DUF7426 domain-containing protein n=1 Tax=Sphaerisporangium krabiense TaxID=763782 RepID=A0A7W9DQ38_9ACTN|nr:hypothetical protein [Sphaerisporangium krabiense]MBB5626619.1 hypothetical protein [Sphaerisporangium krabiense]GII63541.1 hypothetical protein Skr01_36260 [Sphaerisporangium krabiense]